MDAVEFVDLDFFYGQKKVFLWMFVGLHNLAPKVVIIHQY